MSGFGHWLRSIWERVMDGNMEMVMLMSNETYYEKPRYSYLQNPLRKRRDE